MGLKDLLKKRDKIQEDAKPTHNLAPEQSPTKITIMRTDTYTQELIRPPTFASDTLPDRKEDNSHFSKRLSRFRSPSDASATSKASSKDEKRLLTKLHIRSHSRDSSVNSINVPADLPAINDGDDEAEDKEAKWEERATILAQQNAESMSRPSTQQEAKREVFQTQRIQSIKEKRPTSVINLSDAQGDVRFH